MTVEELRVENIKLAQQVRTLMAVNDTQNLQLTQHGAAMGRLIALMEPIAHWLDEDTSRAWALERDHPELNVLLCNVHRAVKPAALKSPEAPAEG